MKAFLRAAFHITPFQVALILALVGIKYLLIRMQIPARLEGLPMIIFFVGSIVLFISSVGILGIIEDKWSSLDNWKEKHKESMKDRLYAKLLKLATVIPFLAYAAFFAYMITPTSVSCFAALLVGIIFGNIIRYFRDKAENAAAKTE